MKKKAVKKNCQCGRIVKDFFHRIPVQCIWIDKVIQILERERVSPELTRSIRSMLSEHECSKRHYFDHNNSVSSVSLNSATPDSGHDHSRIPLENNAQIVIQIPKGQEVSSIRIGFYQEISEHEDQKSLDKF